MFLELQAALAGAVGHRLHAAVVLVARAVEDHARDAGRLRPLGDELADLGRLLALLAGEGVVGHGEERAALRVVDDLRRDVLQRAEHDQARALRGAGDLLPDAQVTPGAQLVAALGDPRLRHYLPPALPALRRMTSPWYLTPFPL